MITRCYFDDDEFIKRNGRTVIVSSDTGFEAWVRIEVIRDGVRESLVTINGDELKKAVDNCMYTNNRWGVN